MKRTILTAAACASFAIAGCGGSDDNGSTASSTDRTTSNTDTTAQGPTTTPKTGNSKAGGSQNLQLSADPSGQLKFDKSTLQAKAGSVTITMDNPSPVAHAVAVEGNGVDKDGNTVNMGGKSSITVTLKKGTYEFYCPVDGHKDAGMKGTLTVK